ncbi:MAG: hypothetical protein IKP00_07655 [Victivallales bacterium]|nr:hypothetical protein [Victivallales bacterium]
MEKTFEQKAAAVLKSMEQDRQKLLTRQPFIGLILMNLELVPMPGNRLRTACTDGRRIMMSISFYAKLDLEERLFVMAHEAWHCVLMHGVRYQTRNQHLFNIAADLEIHFILQKEKMKEPFVLSHDPDWDGLSAEEIYEKLGHKSQRKSKNAVLAPHNGGIFPSSKGGGFPDDNGNFKAPGKQSEHIKGQENGEGFDEHIFSGCGEKPLEDTKEGKRKGGNEEGKGGNKSSEGEEENTPATGKGGAGSDSQNDSDEQNGNKSSGNSGNRSSEAASSDNGENADGDSTTGESSISETPAWDAQSVEWMRRIIIQTAQVIERTQGHLPAHIQGIVEKLRKPELPWRELLRQFVTSCYGGSRRWLPPERRHVSRKLYLPSYRDNRMNAVMAIDTSGSTTGDLPQFFAELSSLLNSFGKYDLTVIQCDCTIQHVETFSEIKHFPRNYQWESYGHGGTSFVPPFNYVREHRLKPEIFIYLTDGFGDAPETKPRYPVLWVLTQDGRTPATWGRCIKLKHSRES